MATTRRAKQRLRHLLLFAAIAAAQFAVFETALRMSRDIRRNVPDRIK